MFIKIFLNIFSTKYNVKGFLFWSLPLKADAGKSDVPVLLVNEEVLLDYGIKAGDPAEYPLNGMEPKTVLVSHGHLDHCGAVPNFMYQDPEVFMFPSLAN